MAFRGCLFCALNCSSIVRPSLRFWERGALGLFKGYGLWGCRAEGFRALWCRELVFFGGFRGLLVCLGEEDLLNPKP